MRRIRDQAVEDAGFDVGQRESRFEVGRGPVKHREPEHAPAQDTEHREQPDQPLGGSQPRLLGPAARFQDLVEDLDGLSAFPPARLGPVLGRL